MGKNQNLQNQKPISVLVLVLVFDVDIFRIMSVLTLLNALTYRFFLSPLFLITLSSLLHHITSPLFTILIPFPLFSLPTPLLFSHILSSPVPSRPPGIAHLNS